MDRWQQGAIGVLAAALVTMGVPSLAGAQQEPDGSVDEEASQEAPQESVEELEEAPDTDQQESASAAATGEAASEFSLQLAAGARGGFTGVAGHGFENGEFVRDNNGNRIPPGAGWPYPEYYPHFGLGGTGGLSLELRFNNIIGLETGVFYSRDNADGYVDKNNANTGTTLVRIHSEQRTTAYHIPLMLKLNVPSDFVRPFVGFGFQFVAQIDSTLEYRQEQRAGQYSEQDMENLNDRNDIEPTNYPLLAGAAGIEVVVGPVRIPVELRVGYALGYDQAMTERARGEDGRIIYDGVYLGHFGIFTGVLYEFDLM